MTAYAFVTRHTCPVCRREVAEVGSTPPVFRPHSDGAGHPCPMAGHPIPDPEATW